MLRKIITSSFLVLTIGMTACSERTSDLTQRAVTAESAETEKPAALPPAQPPGFDEAMTTHKPLGKIKGAVEPYILPLDLADGKFSEALEYVQQRNSYAFLIWHDGAIRHETYFAPHTAELRPDSASMHKSVASLAVGVALDKGLIKSVDEPIGNYIPEWKDQAPGDIKIANILEMNSGLSSLSHEGGATSDNMTFYLQGDKARDLMLGLELEDKPGTVFNYANATSQILALVLEEALDQPYDEFVSENIWQPLGAEDAYVWYNEPNGFPRTYSALMARARDWLKVGLLIKDGGRFNGNQIISAGFIEKMVSPSETNPNYGWQVWLGTKFEPARYYNETKTGYAVTSSAPFKADDLIYFDGFGGQRVYVSASNDLVIVRTGAPSFDWDESFLPNSIINELAMD